MKRSTATATAAKVTPTPTPIPTLAPTERPLELSVSALGEVVGSSGVVEPVVLGVGVPLVTFLVSLVTTDDGPRLPDGEGELVRVGDVDAVTRNATHAAAVALCVSSEESQSRICPSVQVVGLMGVQRPYLCYLLRSTSRQGMARSISQCSFES